MLMVFRIRSESHKTGTSVTGQESQNRIGHSDRVDKHGGQRRGGWTKISRIRRCKSAKGRAHRREVSRSAIRVRDEHGGKIRGTQNVPRSMKPVRICCSMKCVRSLRPRQVGSATVKPKSAPKSMKLEAAEVVFTAFNSNGAFEPTVGPSSFCSESS